MSKRQGKSFRYLLRGNSAKDIQAAEKLSRDLLYYYWSEHAELARQRNEIQDEIRNILIQSCRSDYEFTRWQRGVKYKYCLHPLCTLGSLSFIGGRFNYGSSINAEIPFFPALYIAEDKDTALQEHLGQEARNSNANLSPREAALANPSSETIVSLSGKLDKVFDLTCDDNLVQFVRLLKAFKLPTRLVNQAEKLRIPKSSIIQTKSRLVKDLLNPDWREKPSNYDIPANSQIFSYLIYLAGIEGILYPSTLTKKSCLVVYPSNFEKSDSFIQIDDEPPHKSVPTRIDESNWQLCDMGADAVRLQ